MINFLEFEKLLNETIGLQINKYQFAIKKVFSEGIEIENAYISIRITFRLGEFGFSFINSINGPRLNLTDMILKKYPDYFLPTSNDIVFNFNVSDFKETKSYFQYLVKTSFDFIETNFPEVFEGKF